MRFGIGNNYAAGQRAGSSLIIVDGTAMFKAEVKDGPPLVSLDIWNARGQHTAKLRRNAWLFNDANLAIETRPDSLLLTSGDEILAEVLRPEPDYIWLRQANWYSPRGIRLLIGPANDYDLELRGGDVPLVRLHKCNFSNPRCIIELVDAESTVLDGAGIRFSRRTPGLRIERGSFVDNT
jgi:hypothetical protein